jgi:O-antigen ligase
MCGVLACVGLFVYLADPTFWNRQSTLLDQSDPIAAENTANDMNRVTLWVYAISLAREHPLGVGGMGYTKLSSTFLPAEVIGNSSAKAIHSTYMEALTAFGFLGLLVFLMVVFSGFQELRKTQKQLRDANSSYHRLQGYALLGSYVGFLVSAIFIDRLYCEVTYYFPVFFSIFRNVYGPHACAEPADDLVTLKPPTLAAELASAGTYRRQPAWAVRATRNRR